MIALLATICLASLTLAFISLQKTYGHLPVKEVKRRAQAGDEFAGLLYRAVAYGVSLALFMWVVIGLCAAGLFFAMAKLLPAPLAILGILSVLWFGFAWLPNTRVTAVGRQVVKLLTPVIVWILNYLHPILDGLGAFMKKHASLGGHTRLYQKEDLIDLLRQQQAQADNRIAREELNIAVHALSFGDKLIRDVLIPRSQVQMVRAEDAIGPILMDELHKSGHSRFPVYRGAPDTIVGMLYMRDLVQKKQSGTVAEAMRQTVYYVHEEQNLMDALQAFLKTKRHMFIVVNRFEEIVGIITIEDVLEQIIDKPIVDEFDQYEDLRAVASRAAQKIHKAQKHDALPPEPPEVIQ